MTYFYSQSPYNAFYADFSFDNSVINIELIDDRPDVKILPGTVIDVRDAQSNNSVYYASYDELANVSVTIDVLLQLFHPKTEWSAGSWGTEFINQKLVVYLFLSSAVGKLYDAKIRYLSNVNTTISHSNVTITMRNILYANYLRARHSYIASNTLVMYRSHPFGRITYYCTIWYNGVKYRFYMLLNGEVRYNKIKIDKFTALAALSELIHITCSRATWAANVRYLTVLPSDIRQHISALIDGPVVKRHVV